MANPFSNAEKRHQTQFCTNLRSFTYLKKTLYPFHIAKCAVTPHWTPLSIHPLCCCYTPVCFHTECRISAFWQVRFKKRSKIEQKDIITPMHCLAFPSALFGAPFHIDNRTIANCGFWLEYASKTPLEVGADLPRRMRLFLTPVSNNAASEHSHQTALFSKRLWLRIIGLIWKGYQFLKIHHIMA